MAERGPFGYPSTPVQDGRERRGARAPARPRAAGRRRASAPHALALPLGLAGLALGCPAGGTPTEPAPARAIVVLAASSLTEAFTAVATAFEATRPGVAVATSFAGSQALRLQVEHGTRASVFASADEGHVAALAAAGRVRAPRAFATNALVVAVPRGSALARFEDLPRVERLVVAAPEVPAGAYAERALARARVALGDRFVDAVRARVVSRESNVRQALAKVTLGEAGAAFVYRTDAAVAGDAVRVVPLPDAVAVQAVYVAAPVVGGPHPDDAAAFVDFLLGREGQALLAAHGFGPPPRAGAR